MREALSLKFMRYILWGFVVLAAAGTTLFMQRQPQNLERPANTVNIGGGFTMTSHLGQTMTEKDYRGRPMAMFFGFTNCPDICPTTLLRMTNLMKKLGADAGKLQVVLVSVDPERDTPEILHAYLSQFDPRFTAMTGTPAQLAAFAKNYRFFYKKVPLNGAEYTMDHSAGVYLYSAKGAFVGTLDPHESDEIVLSKLRKLLL